MNTLPLVTNGTKVTTTAPASATAGAVGETTQDSSSQGFLTLLGNKLLTLAKQGETAAQTTVADTATEMADSRQPSTSKAKLNALLASLDKPETLNALLQQPKISTASKTSEKDTDSTETTATTSTMLNNNDMQALFAMLPPAAQQSPAAATSKGSETLENDSNIRGGKQATFASLPSGKDAVATDEGNATNGSDGSDQLTGKAKLTSATQKTAVDTSAMNTTFQQVLGNVTKNTDKENSGSAPPSTIINNVVSTASATLTPTITSGVTAPATSSLSSQLGSPEWQQALGQQIVMFSRNGQQTAELHLHPQDLGSIQISLKLDNDQAQLNMVSGNSHVRAALEAAMPQLRTALADSGINLGQSNVSSDAFQQGQSSSGQQSQQQNNSRGNTFSLAAENDGAPIAVPAALQARAAGSSAVDIFA